MRVSIKTTPLGGPVPPQGCSSFWEQQTPVIPTCVPVFRPKPGGYAPSTQHSDCVTRQTIVQAADTMGAFGRWETHRAPAGKRDDAGRRPPCLGYIAAADAKSVMAALCRDGRPRQGAMIPGSGSDCPYRLASRDKRACLVSSHQPCMADSLATPRPARPLTGWRDYWPCELSGYDRSRKASREPGNNSDMSRKEHRTSRGRHC